MFIERLEIRTGPPPGRADFLRKAWRVIDRLQNAGTLPPALAADVAEQAVSRAISSGSSEGLRAFNSQDYDNPAHSGMIVRFFNSTVHVLVERQIPRESRLRDHTVRAARLPGNGQGPSRRT